MESEWKQSSTINNKIIKRKQIRVEYIERDKIGEIGTNKSRFIKIIRENYQQGYYRAKYIKKYQRSKNIQKKLTSPTLIKIIQSDFIRRSLSKRFHLAL